MKCGQVIRAENVLTEESHLVSVGGRTVETNQRADPRLGHGTDVRRNGLSAEVAADGDLLSRSTACILLVVLDIKHGPATG